MLYMDDILLQSVNWLFRVTTKNARQFITAMGPKVMCQFVFSQHFIEFLSTFYEISWRWCNEYCMRTPVILDRSMQ